MNRHIAKGDKDRSKKAAIRFARRLEIVEEKREKALENLPAGNMRYGRRNKMFTGPSLKPIERNVYIHKCFDQVINVIKGEEWIRKLKPLKKKVIIVKSRTKRSRLSRLSSRSRLVKTS